MLTKRSVIFLIVSMALATFAFAGGGEEPRSLQKQPTRAEPRPADPTVMQKALGEARRAVAPQPASPVRTVPTQPRTVTPGKPASTPKTGGWMLKADNGRCTTTDRLQQEVGTFSTPQEYGRKMQQRGYQSFVLDLGEGQIRVKVPDRKIDLLFVEAAKCR